MKYIVIFFFLFNASFAQEGGFYAIEFTDKKNTPFSINTPQAFLSDRAINRRLLQNIPVTENDLPVNPSYINCLNHPNIKLFYTLKWNNSAVVYINSDSLITLIPTLPFVKSITMIARNDKKLSRSLKGTQSFSEENNFENLTINESDYGASFNQVSQLKLDYLHNLGYFGKDQIIAVFDAGFKNVDIMSAFDSLRSNNRILGTWDFVQGHTNVYDDDTHGTSVLSTMAGYLKDVLIGTAPEASYYLLRTEDAASEQIIEEYNWAAAAEFADSAGADIINSSLGYTTFDDPTQSHTYAQLDGNTAIATIAADMAAGKGILVVNSAGNTGSSSWNFIAVPADGDSVLAVGAVDASGNYASFSSNGPRVDGAVKPNVAAQGKGAILALTSGGTAPGNGTSFSSPILAGAAACLWQANKAATNMQVFNAIQQSANRYTNPDTLVGYGIPDFIKAHALLTDFFDQTFQKESLTLFPNPAENDIGIIFYADSDLNATVKLNDINGRLISVENVSLTSGYTRHHLKNISNLTKGIYFITATTPFGNFTKKFIKL